MIKEIAINNRQYDCFGDNLKVHSSLKKKEMPKIKEKQILNSKVSYSKLMRLLFDLNIYCLLII